MNLALPALVVFVLLLPGFVARSRIKRAERLSLDYSPFGQVVSEAVAWSIVLHLLWIVLTDLIGLREVRPAVVLRLFSADLGSQGKAIEAVALEAAWVALYFGSLLVFSYLMPIGVRALIIRLRLDRVGSRFSGVLRFSGAPWYYLLSGADFEAGDVPDFIVVSAIVDVAGTPYLYIGVLEDYFLNEEGGLDRLILQQVMRRPLSCDKLPEDKGRNLARFYPIDGDYFVLRYSEAITLNVEYVKLASSTAEGSRRSEAPKLAVG